MVGPELVGRLERLCSPSLSIRACAEIAAGSRRRRGENAEPNAPDRRNRFPLRHPRSSDLRRSNLIPIPANRASWGVRNWTVLPSRIISPESGPVRSCQIFMSVLFPAPFSPMKACTSPRPNAKINGLDNTYARFDRAAFNPGASDVQNLHRPSPERRSRAAPRWKARSHRRRLSHRQPVRSLLSGSHVL